MSALKTRSNSRLQSGVAPTKGTNGHAASGTNETTNGHTSKRSESSKPPIDGKRAAALKTVAKMKRSASRENERPRRATGHALRGHLNLLPFALSARSSLALLILHLIIRLRLTPTAPFDDCDEVFNYIEPAAHVVASGRNADQSDGPLAHVSRGDRFGRLLSVLVHNPIDCIWKRKNENPCFDELKEQARDLEKARSDAPKPFKPEAAPLQTWEHAPQYALRSALYSEMIAAPAAWCLDNQAKCEAATEVMFGGDWRASLRSHTVDAQLTAAFTKGKEGLLLRTSNQAYFEYDDSTFCKFADWLTQSHTWRKALKAFVPDSLFDVDFVFFSTVCGEDDIDFTPQPHTQPRIDAFYFTKAVFALLYGVASWWFCEGLTRGYAAVRHGAFLPGMDVFGDRCVQTSRFALHGTFAFSSCSFLVASSVLPSAFMATTSMISIAAIMDSVFPANAHQNDDARQPSRARQYVQTLPALQVPAALFGCIATPILIAWPFALAAFLPVVALSVFAQSWRGAARKCVTMAWWSEFSPALMTSVLACIVILTFSLAFSVVVDTEFYEQPQASALNIVHYNLVENRSNLFGVEESTYYAKNLALVLGPHLCIGLLIDWTSNILPTLGDALLSLFQDAKTKARHALDTHTSVEERCGRQLIALALTSPLVWLPLMQWPSHKEERFLYVIYPALLASGARGLVTLVSGSLTFLFGNVLAMSRCARRNRVSRPQQLFTRTVRCAVAAAFLSAACITYTRIRAMQSFYALPIVSLFTDLHDRLAPQAKPQAKPLTVCLDRTWYRYPGNFFLPGRRVNWYNKSRTATDDKTHTDQGDHHECSNPDHCSAIQVAFLPESHGGILPAPFQFPSVASTSTPFNNENKIERTARYVHEPAGECDILVREEADFNCSPLENTETCTDSTQTSKRATSQSLPNDSYPITIACTDIIDAPATQNRWRWLDLRVPASVMSLIAYVEDAELARRIPGITRVGNAIRKLHALVDSKLRWKRICTYQKPREKA